MTLSQRIKENIDDLQLLNHPFYQAWSDGSLSRSTLKEYAKQYAFHVKAFPRYISATHSKCDDADARRVLLENLNEEEGRGNIPHPELWIRFAEGLGVSRIDIAHSPPRTSISNLIDTFMDSANSSFPEGLASFYTYESQVPEIATTKIKGLRELYNISDKRTLSFFLVHETADVAHREECERIIDKFSAAETEGVLKSSRRSAQALWDFLTDMYEFENAA